MQGSLAYLWVEIFLSMFSYFVTVIHVNIIILFSEIASALTFSLANLSPEYDNYAWNYIVPYRWDKERRQAILSVRTPFDVIVFIFLLLLKIEISAFLLRRQRWRAVCTSPSHLQVRPLCTSTYMFLIFDHRYRRVLYFVNKFSFRSDLKSKTTF